MLLTLKSIDINNNINQQEQGYGNDLFSKEETLPLQGRNEATVLRCATYPATTWRSNYRKVGATHGRRKGMGEGDVQSVLVDLPKYIEEALSEGESVTIRGLGSFNLAITSEGFEHPDDVMPGKVRVSRIYFKPDRMLTGRLRQNMDFFRYPLSKYFPHEMLRPETLERERVQTPNKPEDETKDIDTVTG